MPGGPGTQAERPRRTPRTLDQSYPVPALLVLLAGIAALGYLARALLVDLGLAGPLGVDGPFVQSLPGTFGTLWESWVRLPDWLAELLPAEMAITVNRWLLYAVGVLVLLVALPYLLLCMRHAVLLSTRSSRGQRVRFHLAALCSLLTGMPWLSAPLLGASLLLLMTATWRSWRQARTG